ncbi:MAG TPA: PQQ-binding-like beta-propeller repeat protein [Amycolatopsis sp.]|uniref:outer membrane protein assembly factor BamB family protein n=1 Tax=Amycolatopsis sp. TaxID=37632 RepID=UPI002B45B539|nr:PQQ-binding-like beta-propeller repeat protein [Amycolatopsis sp.]HKS44331.1 PQQ-binding-like beta-propeller repeat protein [Amycolatopsis sp.]
MKWIAVALVMLSVLTGCESAGESPVADPTPTTRDRPSAPVALGTTDWPTYHHDNARTGVAAAVPPPGRLSQAWSAKLDGAVYGQPLVIGDKVIAATENDTVYALAATDGRVLWSRHLGSPQPRSGLKCGNIDPLGITSTAAYDPATGLVFVLAELDGGSHLLAGLDLATGAVTLSRPLEPPQGDRLAHQQRAALTVLDGWVYVAYGGLYGDCGDYIGSVVAAPTTGLGGTRGYAVPTTREAGIWAPGGAAVSGGRLYYAVGNGESTSDYDHSDSVLALTPELTLADSFSPAEWIDDNARDLDLGSMGPAVVGGQVLAVGKRKVGYVLDPARLGGIGGQLSQQNICPAYGGSSVDGSTVYLPCRDGTRAVDVGAGRATVRWQAPVKADGSPVVGGGAVWTIDVASGVLHALDQGTGAVRAQLPVGQVPHFASPTLAGQQAYVGTLSGVVALRGI